MRIIGCDLHSRQQTLAMLDTTTGEVVNLIVKHEGDNVREFYSKLPRPVRVGIEATGSMQCEGIPLMAPRHRDIALRLLSTKKYPDGVVEVHYEVARSK